MSSQQKKNISTPSSRKKPYETPRLIAYGSVKKITGLAKRRRVSDGGTRRT